jgi:hypothetical protein
VEEDDEQQDIHDLRSGSQPHRQRVAKNVEEVYKFIEAIIAQRIIIKKNRKQKSKTKLKIS